MILMTYWLHLRQFMDNWSF